MTTFVFEMRKKAMDDLASLQLRGVIKDPALFWAGRMAMMSRQIAYGSISDLSTNAELLGMYAQEYDNVVMSREPK